MFNEYDGKALRMAVAAVLSAWLAWVMADWGGRWVWLALLFTLLSVTCASAGFWQFLDWRRNEDARLAAKRQTLAQMTPETLAKEQEISTMRLRIQVLQLVKEMPVSKLERVDLAEYLVIEAYLNDRGSVLEKVRALDGTFYFRTDIVRVLANCYQDEHDRWRLPPQHGLPDNLYRTAVQDVSKRLVRMALAFQEQSNGPTFLRLPPAACGERLGVRYGEVERYIERVMA